MKVKGGFLRAGIGPLIAATGVVAGGVVVLGVSEDVTQPNYLATRSDLLVRAARIVTDFGDVGVLALIASAAALLLWHRGVPLVAAAAPALALGVGATLAGVGKLVVDRVGLRLVAEGEPSFPSGHATDSTAMFLTLGLIVAVFVLRRPLARVAVVVGSGLIAAAIGVSRLVLGVHWPTDVVAGWALGATAALAVTIGATLLTRRPPGSQSAAGWLQRVARGLGR